MNATTHAVFGGGGLTKASLLFGEAPPLYAYPAAVVAAWLPDVDNPRSRLGNGLSRRKNPALNLLTRPASWVLRVTSFTLFRTVGHRTLTHSLLGVALFVVLVLPVTPLSPELFLALVAYDPEGWRSSRWRSSWPRWRRLGSTLYTPASPGLLAPETSHFRVCRLFGWIERPRRSLWETEPSSAALAARCRLSSASSRRLSTPDWSRFGSILSATYRASASGFIPGSPVVWARTASRTSPSSTPRSFRESSAATGPCRSMGLSRSKSPTCRPSSSATRRSSFRPTSRAVSCRRPARRAFSGSRPWSLARRSAVSATRKVWA